jgi:hypothetical protein
MESGTVTAPMRLARAIDGCAPVSRAARSHSSLAKDPVANRFGPGFSPISSAKGGQAYGQQAAMLQAGCRAVP